ncbi:MAG: DUF4097 family beta strand repeat-containing protein [Candidatus Delongbacteria bacterium]|jgi:DUF4097 and DUF4098 domain-containing protein YvlB|nr:DUF4097 family beta strand repeat-containing protein [Candidatus Delongbacteria bacterium]
MKTTKIKYIIVLTLLTFITILNSAEIERYTLPSMNGVTLFVLKGVNTTKQITVKGDELDLNVIGLEKPKFELYTSMEDNELAKLNQRTFKDISEKIEKKLNSSIKLNENDNEFMKEIRAMLQEFDMVKKEFKVVMSLEDPSKVEQNKKDKFKDITVEKKGNELIIDLKKVKNSLLLVPQDISLVLDIKKGNLNLQNTNGEIVINGMQLETSITNVSAVINYKNKSGDIFISDYEGVANMKTLQGDINIINSSGKLNFNSAAGDININKFIGDIDINIQVGDIQIMNSDDMSLNLNNKSGDFLLKNNKAKNVEINSASSDIAIFDMIAKNIKISNLSGDILLNAVKSDIDLELNSGDLMLKNFEPLFKKDSKIKVNFGDVDIELKDPNIFKYFQSVNENELNFDKSIKLNKDLKICTKDKKCIVISLNYGQISVEKIK